MNPSPAPTPAPSLADSQVREVCSGVDALYLSGGAELSEDLFALLEEHRAAAEAAAAPVPLSLCGEGFFVEPRSFGKYRYRLAHPSGLFGVTPSDKLPSFYVQPYDRPSRTSTTTPKPSPPTPSNRPNLPPGSKRSSRCWTR